MKHSNNDACIKWITPFGFVHFFGVSYERVMTALKNVDEKKVNDLLYETFLVGPPDQSISILKIEAISGKNSRGFRRNLLMDPYD